MSDAIIYGIVAEILVTIFTLLMASSSVTTWAMYVDNLLTVTPYRTLLRMHDERNLNWVGAVFHALIYLVVFSLTDIILLTGHIIWIFFIWRP